VAKADDSSLDPNQRRAVESRAKSLLDRAAAWDRFPTPIGDILEVAQVVVAPTSVFDPIQIMAYLRHKAGHAAATLKSAISKVFGICDVEEHVIHIDDTVSESKQTFLKLHETGHLELPTHRKLFRVFQDCEKTLAPEISDLFEREANNFARFALFQGRRFGEMAADCDMKIQTPMKLAKKFGASVYAGCREFARTHQRACVVYVLEPIQFAPGTGAQATVRRIEPSGTFEAQFGYPTDSVITLDHPLGRILPVGRRMTRPTTLSIKDRNGVAHECVAEAFDSTFNVFILLYPVKALTASTIILPSDLQAR